MTDTQPRIPTFWKLDDDHVAQPATIEGLGAMLPDDRRVGLTEVHTASGTVMISTVFLGVDHSPGHEEGPVLFETMVGQPDGSWPDQTRYRTWDEAAAGHKAQVAQLMARYVTGSVTHRTRRWRWKQPRAG